jgi:uncharacterized protein (DUF3820 family)
MNEFTNADKSILLDLVKTKMPYGKYKGTLIYKIPVHYLEWLKKKGFPSGRLGMMLETCFEIKTNGLEYLLKPIINNSPNRK